MVTLEKPSPIPSCFQARGGPSSGHCCNKPVSAEISSRFGPRHWGQKGTSVVGNRLSTAAAGRGAKGPPSRGPSAKLKTASTASTRQPRPRPKKRIMACAPASGQDGGIIQWSVQGISARPRTAGPAARRDRRPRRKRQGWARPLGPKSTAGHGAMQAAAPARLSGLARSARRHATAARAHGLSPASRRRIIVTLVCGSRAK